MVKWAATVISLTEEEEEVGKVHHTSQLQNHILCISFEFISNFHLTNKSVVFSHLPLKSDLHKNAAPSRRAVLKIATNVGQIIGDFMCDECWLKIWHAGDLCMHLFTSCYLISRYDCQWVNIKSQRFVSCAWINDFLWRLLMDSLQSINSLMLGY